jgi:hypothetical protein
MPRDPKGTKTWSPLTRVDRWGERGVCPDRRAVNCVIWSFDGKSAVGRDPELTEDRRVGVHFGERMTLLIGATTVLSALQTLPARRLPWKTVGAEFTACLGEFREGTEGRSGSLNLAAASNKANAIKPHSPTTPLAVGRWRKSI